MKHIVFFEIRNNVALRGLLFVTIVLCLSDIVSKNVLILEFPFFFFAELNRALTQKAADFVAFHASKLNHPLIKSVRTQLPKSAFVLPLAPLTLLIPTLTIS